MLSCGLNLGRSKPPLIVEHFDLMQVWCPFLIVRGLEFEEDMVNEEMVRDHFEAISGTKIESIELKGTEAKISFIQLEGMITKK